MAYLALNHHGYLSIRFRVRVNGKLIQCCEGTKVRVRKVENEYVPDEPSTNRSLARWVEDI